MIAPDRSETVRGGCNLLSWHVATVNPFSELLAEEHLKADGFQPFNPKFRVARVTRGRKVITERPYIPGYIFIRFDRDDDERWPRINRTPGVRALLYATYNRPAPIRDEVMELILAQCAGDYVIEAEADKVLAKFIPVGSRVRITAGTFEGHSGPVTLAHAERVDVILKIFGRPTKVNVLPEQVEMVSACA